MKRLFMNLPFISSFRHATTSEPASFEATPMAKAEPVDTTGGNVSATDSLRALQIGEEQRLRGREPRSRHKRSSLWRYMVVVGIVVIATVAWLWLYPKTISVQVATVLPASNTGGGLLTAGGYVKHARIVNVVPRVSGIVATLRVSEGDIVHEGDLIATLDGKELAQQVVESRADLRAAQARLAELEAGWRSEEIAGTRARVDARRSAAKQMEREKNRTKALFEAGVLPAQTFEQVESENLVAQKTLEEAQHALALLEAGPRTEVINAARASVDGARARLARATDLLGRTNIRAPLSGRVLRKFLEVGAVVSFGLPYTEGYTTLGPGSPIVTIGQLEGLEAIADINQTDLGRLSLGQNVEVSADAFPGKTYHARITRFSPRADRNKNTVEVTVRFTDPAPGELIHDLSVKLSFLNDETTAGSRGLLIPSSAVIEQAGTQGVFVVEEGLARLRRITAGPSLPSKLVPVKEGLAEGEMIVITKPEALKDGNKVAPMSVATHKGEDN